MTLIYGLAIATGAGGLLFAVGLALNPARATIAPMARHTLLGMTGFGLGGMSASFAGWPTALSLLAAAVGAAVLAAIGIRYGAEADE